MNVLRLRCPTQAHWKKKTFMKHKIAVAEATMSFCFASETLFQVSYHARLCDANVKSIRIKKSCTMVLLF